MSLNSNYVFETTFTFRIRVATYTAHGGIYLRDVALPVSFDTVQGFHEIVLDFLQTEGVRDFQLLLLKPENLRFTCPHTRTEFLVPNSAMDIPDGAVVYYRNFAPPEMYSLACPPLMNVLSISKMLYTADPAHLHVFFSGHRLSLPFPAAKDDFEIVRYAVKTLLSLGIAFDEEPLVASVCTESSRESPRCNYTGRQSLHSKCLELIGYWKNVPRAVSNVPCAPLFPCTSKTTDALSPAA